MFLFWVKLETGVVVVDVDVDVDVDVVSEGDIVIIIIVVMHYVLLLLLLQQQEGIDPSVPVIRYEERITNDVDSVVTQLLCTVSCLLLALAMYVPY